MLSEETGNVNPFSGKLELIVILDATPARECLAIALVRTAPADHADAAIERYVIDNYSGVLTKEA